MPNIFAVIGAAVRNVPIIGAIADVPAFRDPGPGQYLPSQRPSHGPTPQTRGPRIHHYNRGAEPPKPKFPPGSVVTYTDGVTNAPRPIPPQLRLLLRLRQSPTMPS